jgi:transposase InsO family protein
MHKNTKLLPRQRQEIFRRWSQGERVVDLGRHWKVSRQTIYKIIGNAKHDIFINRRSMNERYRTLYWGLKRLTKIERQLGEKLARLAHKLKRYEKAMPGEMVHVDTKRLPLLRGEGIISPREYLFVAIDDFSRFLYADIFPDKTSYSSAIFLDEVKRFMPFRIEKIYSDNGSEYKGKDGHPFHDACKRYGYAQGFTKVKHPWTNGKAERVIRTLMEEWHSYTRSNHLSREHRRRHLYAYIDWYNQSRIHGTIESTPLERLEQFIKRIKENM